MQHQYKMIALKSLTDVKTFLIFKDYIKLTFRKNIKNKRTDKR